MTWPIDVAEELKELDDELDGKTDYTTLIEAQRSYKAAMLNVGVISALRDILLPTLVKKKAYVGSRRSTNQTELVFSAASERNATIKLLASSFIASGTWPSSKTLPPMCMPQDVMRRCLDFKAGTLRSCTRRMF